MTPRWLDLALLGSIFIVACGSIAEDPAPFGRDPSPSSPGSPDTTPSPTPVAPPGGCSARAEAEARDGVAAIPALDVGPCTFHDFDATGAVLSIVRTFDGKAHVLTESYDRVDEPPRTTEHDDVYGAPPRHTRTSHQYDPAGRRTHSWFDDDADGTTDSERWWAFDAAGDTVTEGYSWGKTTAVTTRTFAPGAFLLTETDARSDDVTVKTTFTRRSDGSPLTRSYERGSAVESSATWTYDVQDVATMVEHEAIRRTTTRTDAKGNLLETREDQPKDGVDDYIRQLTYDGAGHLLQDHAFGKNGEKYGDLVQTFDANGRPIEIWKQWGFGQVGGATTDDEKRAYDACGQVTSIKRTQNGAPQSEIERTYDARGFLATEEERRFKPSSMGTKTTRTFDAQGRLLALSTYTLTGAAWTLDQTETRTYDTNGHVTKIATTSPTRPAKNETFTYDAKGRLTLHERSPTGPESIVREELDYACLP